MGKKTQIKDRKWYRGQIRKINRELKKKKLSPSKKDKLMDLKDMLIDGLMFQCAHTTLIQAPPEEEEIGPNAHSDVRACLLCGDMEYLKNAWLRLTGSADIVDRRDLTIQLGSMLKDMGINL